MSDSPTPDPEMGLKTAPDVWIDERDRWRFKSEIIVNEEVLQYFKSNLNRDAQGFFIENRWGEKRELGYLRGVFGFPLLAQGLHFLDGLDVEFRIDSGAKSVTSITELFSLDDKTLAFITAETGLPVRLAPQAMVQLSDRLHIDEEERIWFQIPDSKKISLARRMRADIFPDRREDLPDYGAN